MNLSVLKNKKVAILGLGYIGSNILDYLENLSLNIDLTLIDRENIKIIEDKEFDYLINASGNSGNFRSQLIETVESNLNLNCYILEKAKIKESYIYISSSRVYGFTYDKNIVFNESSVNHYNHLNLDFIYDGSKKLAESLLFNYSNNVNYNIGILRLSNVYGKFNTLDDSTLIKKIIRFKKENKNNLEVNQNRNSKKDYIYIDDVVESIINIMLNIEKTDIYNLSSGNSYSLYDISRFIDINIVSDDSVEPSYSNISNEKMIKDFNIKLKYNIEDEFKKLN